jgi:ribosomal protein S14
MKKLFVKDKKTRFEVKQSELKTFILKQIAHNFNFFKPVRWNAVQKLTLTNKKSSKTHFSNRCIKTINKKTFHKFSNYSRMEFLKLIRSGMVSGMRKSCW